MPNFSLSQLEQRVWDNLDGNTAFYPEPNVRGVINEGLRRLNIVLGISQDTVPVPGFTVAGQREYATPTGIVIPLKVYYEGRVLAQWNLRNLANHFRKWATDTTANAGPVARWAPIGLGMFITHPIDNSGGGLLEVQGVAPITPLTSVGQTVALPDEMGDILVDYCKSRIMLKEIGLPFYRASLGYQEMIKKVKPLMLWRGLKFAPYYLISEQAQPQQQAQAS